MKDLSFEFLNPEQKDEIVALRKECYIDYYGSRLNPSGLDWNYTDQHSIHLAFRNKGTLVSYLRLSLFSDRSRLEKTTLFPTPQNVQFPVGLLARAATRKDFSNLKLHNSLRASALELCASLNVPTVLGSLEERSARVESLKEIGYKILDRQPTWPGSYIQSTGPVILIGLCSKDEILNASRKLKKTYPTDPNFGMISSVSYL